MILDGVKDYMPIIIHIAGESEGTSHVWWWGERWGSTLGMQTIGNPTPREYSSMGAKKQRGTSLGQPMSRMDTTARQRWTQIDGWAEPLAWAEESSYKCILGVGKQGTCNIYRRNISRNAIFISIPARSVKMAKRMVPPRKCLHTWNEYHGIKVLMKSTSIMPKLDKTELMGSRCMEKNLEGKRAPRLSIKSCQTKNTLLKSSESGIQWCKWPIGGYMRSYGATEQLGCFYHME